MNKCKFASLILLGAFSAGVASSSAVSAQGDGNLASTVDISIGSHDESAVAFDETKIDTETTTDEETKNAITDENNDARDDTENLDKDINDKAGSPEDSDKENSKNKDYVFAYIKEQNVKKSKGVGMAEGLAVAGGGASAVSGATFGISKLVKSSGNDKKDEPSPETNPESDKPTGSEEEEKEPEKKDELSPETNPESDKPTDPKKEEKELEEKEEKDPEEKFKKEEKGGFVEWYKNNLVVSIPLTIIFLCISLIICRMVYFKICRPTVVRKPIDLELQEIDYMPNSTL